MSDKGSAPPSAKVSPGVVEVDAEKPAVVTLPKTVEVRQVKKIDNELHIVLRNQTSKPQDIVLKAGKLSSDFYGLYNNGTYIGRIERKVLESGVKVTLPYTVVPDWQENYIRNVHDNAQNTQYQFKTRVPNDAAVAWDALNDAKKYTNSMVIAIEAWRSSRLILTLNDASPRQSFTIKRPDEKLQTIYTDTNMYYVTLIRRTICNKTSPGEIRDLAMSAVTPVSIKYQIPDAKPGSKFVAKVTITNETNVPINAMPFFAGAPGWVFKPKKAAAVENLGPLQTAVLEYWGVAPSAPEKVAVKPSGGLQVRVSNTGFKFNLVPLPAPVKNTTPSTTSN
jgi:hypothetical protein